MIPRVFLSAGAAALAVVALLGVSCSSGSGTGEAPSTPASRNATGLPTSAATAPPAGGFQGDLIVYRNTLQADAVAVSLNYADVWSFDYDSANESVLGVDCTRDGASAAYLMENNTSLDNRLIVVTGGVRKEYPLSGEIVGMAWSPEGSKIALTAYIPDRASGRLSVLDISNGQVTDLATRPGTIGYPRWAPDGNRIVYDATVERGNQLFVYTLGQPEPQQITSTDQNAFGPDWSPVSDEIVFSSFAADGNPQLFTVSASGGEMKQLTSSQVFKANPRWSSDGQRIAYVGTVPIPMAANLGGGASPVSLSLHDALSHNVAVFTSAPDGSDEVPFTDVNLDAWLLGWCTAGPWLDEGWTRQ